MPEYKPLHCMCSEANLLSFHVLIIDALIRQLWWTGILSLFFLLENKLPALHPKSFRCK